MTRAHLDDIFASMLADLQSILDALNTGLVVHVGVVQSLAGKLDGVSTLKVCKSNIRVKVSMFTLFLTIGNLARNICVHT